MKYVEGSDVGYRWYLAKKKTPLFPFGFGLSYTTFKFENATVNGNQVSFDVVNSGQKPGAAVPQVYATPPKGHTRLVGFARVDLAPGERRHVTVAIDQRFLAKYDTAAPGWHVAPGSYRFTVASDADDKGVSVKADIAEAKLAP